MQQYKKMDAFQVAQTNKYNVIRCLIREGPINRAAIAKRISLSIPTVMLITEDLLQKQVIRSIGKGESSGGKPPEMLEIIPDRFYYIGVDIGRTTIRAAAANAISQQVAYLQEPTGDPSREREFVDRLGRIVLQLADSLKTTVDRILGAGIAMPGLIEPGTGNVLFSPDFGWNNIPLKAWLGEKIPFPITVENANRALAGGSYSTYSARNWVETGFSTCYGRTPYCLKSSRRSRRKRPTHGTACRCFTIW